MALKITWPRSLPSATFWRINAKELGAINVPGQPESVTTTQVASRAPLDEPLFLPPHSVTVVEVKYAGE